MIKRMFDIIFSFLFFVLLSPLVLVIIALVVIDSKGSPFFSQVRIGRHGREFVLYKVRTMRPSEKGSQITIGADKRITRIGKVLRKYKLDELPQLLNILKGEMSFIGPRPEVPKYVQHYSEEQKKVLNVRPGLSDPASLMYFNEAELLSNSSNPEKTYLEDILPAKLALSLDYIENRSFIYDLKLIFRTIGRIAN